jgi:hypothetical protein
MSMFKDCGCGCDGRKQEAKFLVSFVAALLFFLVSSPEMYQLTRRIFGSWVAGPTGCSSTLGLVLHSVVFLLITWGLMNFTAKKM